MSLLLFNISECTKNTSENRSHNAKLTMNDVEELLLARWIADDTVVLAKSRSKLQKVVDKFDKSCRKMKLRLNLEKSNIKAL